MIQRIAEAIKSWPLYRRFTGWWSPAQPAPIPANDPTLPADAAEKIGLAKWTSIHDLLEILPNYFDDLRSLRRCDPDLYDVFSTVGGRIMGEDSLFRMDAIPDEFMRTGPSVRAGFFGTYHNDQDANTRAMCLMRVAGGRVHLTPRGHVVTPSTGLNYRFSILWRIRQEKWGLAQSCFVNIDQAGRVRALAEKHEQVQRIKGGDIIRHRAIRVPAWMADCAKSNGRNQQVDVWLQEIVALAASQRSAETPILVRATLGTLTASWTIDRRDAKRFFRKRDRDGETRKRILHYVAPFDRVVNSREQHVREHYRGERSFDWMGYKIAISGLGFHHGDYFDAPIDTFDEADRPRGQMLTLKSTMGRVLSRYNEPRFLSKKRGQRA